MEFICILKTRKPQSFNATSCMYLLTLRSSWGGRNGSCAWRRELLITIEPAHGTG